MRQYDLVENGIITKEKVRRSVIVRLNGVKVKYSDITKLTDLERKEAGIYARIDPPPVYNGYFEKINPKSSGVVNDSECTVTYETTITPLGIEESRTNLLRVTQGCYRGSEPTEGYDLDAIHQNHIDTINAMTTWSEISSYNHCANWPDCGLCFK